MSSRFDKFLSPSRRTYIKPITSIATAILTFAILLVATQKSLFADIAAYSAGASIGALVSGIAGSGTSLAYVTGDAQSQFAVRRVRYAIVAPAMVASAFAAGFVYSGVSDLHLLSVVAGGLAVSFNNLGELGSAMLERKLATPQMFFATLVSRGAGLIAIILGSSFSGAMLFSSFFSFILLTKFAKPHERRREHKISILASIRLAYSPSLMSISVIGIVIGRLVLLVVPFLLPAAEAGAVASLISAQQAITGVLISGLYTLMAARSEAGRPQDWMRRVARLTLIFALIITVLSALATPLVVRLLNLTSFGGAHGWWVVLSLAIFPFVIVRRVQYLLLGEGRREETVLLLIVDVIATSLFVGFATLSSLTTWLPATSLFAEGTTVLAAVIFRYYRRRR